MCSKAKLSPETDIQLKLENEEGIQGVQFKNSQKQSNYIEFSTPKIPKTFNFNQENESKSLDEKFTLMSNLGSSNDKEKDEEFNMLKEDNLQLKSHIDRIKKNQEILINESILIEDDLNKSMKTIDEKDQQINSLKNFNNALETRFNEFKKNNENESKSREEKLIEMTHLNDELNKNIKEQEKRIMYLKEELDSKRKCFWITQCGGNGNIDENKSNHYSLKYCPEFLKYTDELRKTNEANRNLKITILEKNTLITNLDINHKAEKTQLEDRKSRLETEKNDLSSLVNSLRLDKTLLDEKIAKLESEKLNLMAASSSSDQLNSKVTELTSLDKLRTFTQNSTIFGNEYTSYRSLFSERFDELTNMNSRLELNKSYLEKKIHELEGQIFELKSRSSSFFYDPHKAFSTIESTPQNLQFNKDFKISLQPSLENNIEMKSEYESLKKKKSSKTSELMLDSNNSDDSSSDDNDFSKTEKCLFCQRYFETQHGVKIHMGHCHKCARCQKYENKCKCPINKRMIKSELNSKIKNRKKY
ncbi:unnamed protein product [Brachionus calyciflorus]|uniref:Uncharacterized protein n=1 Tax=Brachionus calyciflorus TaxID=104777 RepID=A0A814CW54_9BILA|nr:unnamed protein product [Brachionus calyciflorus]